MSSVVTGMATLIWNTLLIQIYSIYRHTPGGGSWLIAEVQLTATRGGFSLSNEGRLQAQPV